MARPAPSTLALLTANVLSLGALAFGLPQSAPAAVPERAGDCFAEGAALTVEEQRITEPLPGQEVPAATQLIEAGGLEGSVADLERRLCTARDVRQASRAVQVVGSELWQTAVDRAQGRQQLGSIDRYDDRPLYWARTSMTRALREWVPSFPLDALQRQALVRELSYAGRGIDSVDFTDDEDVTTVLVSGFDTYSLDSSLRNSNPSGASALQLDGRVFETDAGPVQVQAVVFPVNWSDFDQGIVEDAFGPWLVAEDHPEHAGSVDTILTISQTGRGRMDIEKWAGGFRGGSPDNNRALNWGPVSAAALWPQPQPSPQFIQTTLPYQEMIDAGTGPWPVRLNPGIAEWPRDTFPDPASIRRADDPSPGSRAASAPGGNYLSNESMYRTNRLRLGAGREDLPGGHLHISSLVYPDDPAALTSPAFEADRKAVVDQTVALVQAAGRGAAS